VLAAVPGLMLFGLAAPVALLAATLAAGLFVLWFAALLRRRIGGSTGDCLGFAAYAGQLILLLAATA
jgi:adenosylcobinamide-GDP ribazoletransferase